ncbi:MAG: T9SS type A sorting domain-containing protein [Bacteroidales bacterium]|nr:T9SS type A sorting domain-containing protein [Bacteroidales bacterium]
MKPILLSFFLITAISGYCQINTTIEAIQQNHILWDGVNVTIEGVVFEGAGVLSNSNPNSSLTNVYMADSNGVGLYLYKSSFNLQDSLILIRGNKVRVSGRVINYNNMCELIYDSISLISLGTPNLINYSNPISIAQACDTTTYEGFYIETSGYIVNKINSALFGYHIILKQGSDSIDLYVPQNATVNINYTNWNLNSFIKVRGALSIYNSKPQIFVGYLEDYELINGLTEVNEPAIEIFPNPAQDYINIYNTKLYNSILIYNLQGKLILQKPIKETKAQINISNLAKGMYLIRVESEDESLVRRFVKE